VGKAPPPISRSMAIDDSWIRSQPRCRKQSRIRYGAKVRKAVFNGKLYEHTEIVGIAWFVAIFSLRIVIALYRRRGYYCGQKPTP
jgi:hypothetical protein